MYLISLIGVSSQDCDTGSEDGDVSVCQRQEEVAEEGDIDEHLNTLEPDDPVLIEAIQNYYLDKPNPNFELNIPARLLTDKELAVSSI